MNLSVLINTYNRPGPLAECLAALAGQRGASPFETIIVDDGGQADLAAAVAPWRDRLGLRLERIAHAGRAAARNHAVALARGRRVLFLGDDVIAGPDCVAVHQQCADPLVAILGPYPVADLKGSPPFRRWAEPNPQHEITNPADAGFWFFATGNLSLDRELFLLLGGFDTRFAVYGWEDIDLGLRFDRAGGRLVFEPRAAAVHRHPQLTREQLWRREYEMGMTALQFWEKWADVESPRIARMRFWDDPAALGPGSPLRRRVGDALAALTDAVAPGSSLNAWVYQRMIFACRLAGVAEGWRAARATVPTGVKP